MSAAELMPSSTWAVIAVPEDGLARWTDASVHSLFMQPDQVQLTTDKHTSISDAVECLSSPLTSLSTVAR